MYDREFLPFYDRAIQDVISERLQELKNSVEALTDDEILANDENILANNLYEKLQILPIVIMEEDKSKRKTERKTIKIKNEFSMGLDDSKYHSAKGVAIDLFFPFDGDSILLFCYGVTTTTMIYPRIRIFGKEICLHYEYELREGCESNIKATLYAQRNNDISSLQNGIDNLKIHIEEYNSTLKERALKELRKKKSEVSSFRTLSKILEIPLHQTDFAKTHIPVQRRLQPIKHKYQQDPIYTISDKDYKDILMAIKYIGSAIEQTPNTFKSMGEEDLRNVFLALLNVLYLGTATGETFRKDGKTDICIKEGTLAAFVAECKMWEGKKKIEEAIGQLDNYLTWRDCKTALIYFVDRQDFISILNTAKVTISSISNIKEVKEIDKNEIDCIYYSKATPGNNIRIRIFLFNIKAGIPFKGKRLNPVIVDVVQRALRLIIAQLNHPGTNTKMRHSEHLSDSKSCLVFLCPKPPKRGHTAPSFFVLFYQRLHAPEISGFPNVLTPYIVVRMNTIYNMLYLAPRYS